jgi:hypothetical protein
MPPTPFAQSPSTSATKKEAIRALEKLSVQDRITDQVPAIGPDRTFQLMSSAACCTRCLPRLEHGINPCRPLVTNP